MKREHGSKFFRHTLIPLIFSFFYFWVVYFIYMFSPKTALEINYLFEDHAFLQYQQFLDTCGEELKKKSVRSEFLEWYGRHPMNEYELFRSIRNDEVIHRNRSIRELEALKDSH